MLREKVNLIFFPLIFKCVKIYTGHNECLCNKKIAIYTVHVLCCLNSIWHMYILGSMLLCCYMYVELGIKQALNLDSFVIFWYTRLTYGICLWDRTTGSIFKSFVLTSVAKIWKHVRWISFSSALKPLCNKEREKIGLDCLYLIYRHLRLETVDSHGNDKIIGLLNSQVDRD